MLTLTSLVETPLHRLRAGPKLAALALSATALLLTTDLRVQGAALLLVAGLYLTGGRAFAVAGARLLWPLWPFLVVLAVWHGWNEALHGGAVIALRLVTAMALANLVTLTTRLDDLIAVVEKLAAPLARLGLPPRRLALAIALVIRFTPVLLDKARGLMQAWRARSPRRPGWRVVVPLTLIALDDADHVAEALRARGGL
jgi:biotin transport system permease protein